MNDKLCGIALVLGMLLGLGLLAVGCSINPATGKRQLTLVSESQEREMGRQYDQQIVQQLGAYEDPDLQAYVQGLGKRLAASSERPDLPWSFRVVDDPVVNAFALPGGYIYVTRGIMAHLNSEAELAAVVGHEIGHVTARHSVNQMSKAQLAQLGLGVGAILAPERMDSFGGLLQTGVGLLFLKYSRDDERQADDLGLRYLMRGGYNPWPMAEVFGLLEAVSASGGGGRAPGWLATHPAPENRREWAQRAIPALGQDLANRPVRREEYLDRIDGMVYGEDPRDGFFRESRFLHPRMKFQLAFPEGWTLVNQRSVVGALSPDKDAIVQLTLSAEGSARGALDKFFAQQGVTRTDGGRGSIHGLPTAGAGFTAQTEQGALEGLVAFVEYGGRVFQLTGYAPSARWAARSAAVERSLQSFDGLDDPAVLSVEPRRLRVVRADRATSLAELARRNGATVPVESLALLNQLDETARLEAGQRYKLVTGGPAS